MENRDFLILATSRRTERYFDLADEFCCVDADDDAMEGDRIEYFDVCMIGRGERMKNGGFAPARRYTSQEGRVCGYA